MKGVLVFTTVALLAAMALPTSLGDGVAPAAANDCQENSSFRCCGDIQLVFRNPDLNPKSKDDKVTAQGQFFAQFQAIGADADKITFFGFSFSPAQAQAEEEHVCAQQPWAPSGPYIVNYRADTDPDDGFFINLQTTLVPDGEYLAAVHAYDANDNEIARAWTLAIVDNCDSSSTGERCDSDDYPTEEHIAHDKTMPWPIVLPGDGELDPAKNDAPGEATLTLEFAEPLSELRVFLNGLLIHEKGGTIQEMEAYEGREWDDDLLPGYGPLGLGGLIAEECSQQPPQNCGTLGEAWYWPGRALEDDDVVRVEAVDLAGNLAKKELHIGSGQGGAITSELPRLQATADVTELTVPAGQAAVFRVDMQNTGGSTAHPFTGYDEPIIKQSGARAPGTWDVSWRAHEAVAPGAKSTQEFTVKPGNDVPIGIYQVNGTISWNEGTEQKDRKWQFQVNVGESQAGELEENATADGGSGAKKESPGPALPLLFTAAALVAWRRRQ